jgi:glycosyltransferase involved in cell wall biosynthesis
LVDWKRLDIAIEAVARIPQAELEIIGEGPRRLAWTELTRNLRITERVRFVGWLSQQECAERLRSATALLLPSIYECGGAVVLEAMACGVPVVATSWGGPADYINATCGFLVDTASRETIVDGFTDAMRKLIADPVLCDQLGAAGRQRVEDHFDWAKKIDQILSLYREARNSGVPPTVADTGRVS